MNVAPPVAPAAVTRSPYGTSEAICSATAAMVPAMLRTVPRTASVIDESSPRTRASPWLTSQFQMDTTIRPGRLSGVAARSALNRAEMVPLIQFAVSEQTPPLATARRFMPVPLGPVTARSANAFPLRLAAADGLGSGGVAPPSVARSEANRTRTTAGNRSVGGESRSCPAMSARDSEAPGESAAAT